MQNVFGLVSGFDAGAIIDATMQARRAPIQKLQQQKSGIETQISDLGELKSKLGELKSALDGMQSLDEVLSLSGSSSNEDLVGVNATADASPSTYDVSVSQLARAEKDRSVAFASALGEVSEGTLSLSVDGAAAVDVAIAAGDTLQDVADNINASGAGVSATVIHDGNGGYHLQLSSKETGYSTANASDAIQITESYTGTGGQQLGLTEVVTAQNAAFSVDGLAVESASNSVSDIIPGVNLDLYATGDVTIDVAQDKAGTKERIQGFVDAYNDVAGFLKDALHVDENTDRTRSLAGDSVARGAQRDLTSIVSGQLTGLAGPFGSLSQIGIKTDGTGKLAIDGAELDAALDQDMEAVGEMFVAADVGLADQISDTVDIYTRTGDGLLVQHDEALNGRIDHIDDRIGRMEGRLEQLQDRMVRQFTAMENAMAEFQAQGQSLTGLLGG
ncbi:MAG: flagellar filament capping protein FliD [Myxococcota bacterium]